MDQLALYSASRPEISAADVSSLLGKSAEEDVFRLADFILAGQNERALEALEGLLREGIKPLEILGTLASQLEKLKKAAEFLKKGHSVQETGVRFGVHPFYQEKFATQAHSLSQARAEALLKKILSHDEMIKTGRLEERLSVESFFLSN